MRDLDDFKKVYEENHGYIRQSLFRIMGKDLVDDAVQETFIKAWKARDGFKGDSSVRTWLYKIASRTALDILRAKKDTVSLDDAGEISTGRSGMENTFIGEEIQKIMNSMPIVFRMAVDAVIFENLSIKEASDILGATEGTIKSRVSRGREILQTELKKAGYNYGT